MRFEEFSKYEWFSFTVENFNVHILFSKIESNILVEGKSKPFDLGGVYSAQLHQAHIPAGQAHLHIYAKKNQLFAINKDGSAHDKSHGTEIPNKVAHAISQKFPEFIIPKNNFIESAPDQIHLAFGAQILNE